MTFDEFRKNYNIKLNPQQLDAVRSVDGPVLLLAVPGSGKTTVLVTRLGFMIYCCGIAPERILTLTYTVAATHDMARRFESYFGPKMREYLEFRTINGICARVISCYGRMIGKSPFRLVTEDKSTAAMLSSIFQETEKSYPTESDIKSVRTLITYIKNSMLSQEEILQLEEEAGLGISQIYCRYVQEMKRQRLMDYDDQMIHALTILRHSPEILRYFQNQYPYICVDEAQDTSRIQHEIIALLAKGSGNLFMVGDEDQSIYGFRAAYPEALLSFEQNHPGAKVLLMEENFRSNANIVAAADRFIQKNTLRHEKHMKSTRDAGPEIKEITLKARKAQYAYLAKVAENCRTETAVLYRYNESVLPLVDLLERGGVPYRMRNADLTFFTHRIVLDIQNIICFAMNPEDAELFMKIYYKLGLYINKQDAQLLATLAAEKHMPVLEAAVRFGDLPENKATNMKSMCAQLHNLLEETAEQAISRIVKVMGYGGYLERAGMGDGKIFILKAIASHKESPAGFLQRMAQLQQLIKEKENDPQCPFILSTIHASKGLEYDTVYLLDVADGIFPESVPASLKKADPKEREAYEEERRIFYVGITRAKDRLNLFSLPAASVFCRELLGNGWKAAAVTGRTAVGKKAAGPAANTGKNFNQEEYDAFCDSLGEGIGIRHKKYGFGIVTERTEEYITVDFQGIRKKFSMRIVYENELIITQQ